MVQSFLSKDTLHAKSQHDTVKTQWQTTPPGQSRCLGGLTAYSNSLEMPLAFLQKKEETLSLFSNGAIPDCGTACVWQMAKDHHQPLKEFHTIDAWPWQGARLFSLHSGVLLVTAILWHMFGNWNI